MQNIKKIKNFTIIEKNESLKRILEFLNMADEKILFVVENSKFIGTITDGDLRRFFYKNKINDLKKYVAENIMNKNPKYIFEKDLKYTNIKELMIKYKVNFLPILDNNMKIKEVLFISINYQKLSKLRTKILIMAGGKGTRLYPLTKVIPKPLVPYGDKTIIENIMDQFINSGFDDFILSVNYKKDMIKKYFSDLKYNIDYIEEDKFLGTAGSIFYLRFHDIHKPFFLANCDVLLDVDFKEVLEYHESANSDITIIASKESRDIAYGVLKFDKNNNLIEIVEKPNYSFYVNTGIYVLNPKVIKLVSINERIDMPELINKARVKKLNIKIYKSKKQMIDIGRWEYYKKLL